MKKQLKKITAGCLIVATLLASVGVFAMDSEEFNRRMDEGMKAYIQKDYATATNLFQRLYNEGNLSYEQEQRVLNFLDSSKSNQYGLPSKNQSNTQTATQQTINNNSISTAEFDSGMAKGIWYFNKGMYYEAKDEFQWFCDYNWGKMNVGQQKYALDYLGATRGRIKEYESIVHLEYGAPPQYGGLYHITANEAIRLIKVVYGVSTYHVGTSNVFFQFYGEGREFRVNRWYNTPAVTVDEVIIPLF